MHKRYLNLIVLSSDGIPLDSGKNILKRVLKEIHKYEVIFWVLLKDLGILKPPLLKGTYDIFYFQNDVLDI